MIAMPKIWWEILKIAESSKKGIDRRGIREAANQQGYSLTLAEVSSKISLLSKRDLLEARGDKYFLSEKAVRILGSQPTLLSDFYREDAWYKEVTL